MDLLVFCLVLACRHVCLPGDELTRCAAKVQRCILAIAEKSLIMELYTTMHEESAVTQAIVLSMLRYLS